MNAQDVELFLIFPKRGVQIFLTKGEDLENMEARESVYGEIV